MLDLNEDIEVVRAQRLDIMRGVLKLIRVMVLAVQKHAQQAERRGLVTAPELWAMSELRRTPGLRVIDLAKSMAIHPSSVKAMVTALESRGLVRTISSGNGVNTLRLALTEEGRGVLDATPGPAQGVVLAALEQLDDSTLKKLVNALQPLVSAMQYTDGSAALKSLSDIMCHDSIQVRKFAASLGGYPA
jgi:DNA-binding MarR family transcriptional regulator